MMLSHQGIPISRDEYKEMRQHCDESEFELIPDSWSYGDEWRYYDD